MKTTRSGTDDIVKSVTEKRILSPYEILFGDFIT